MAKIKPSLCKAGSILAGAGLVLNLAGCLPEYKFEHEGKQYKAMLGVNSATIYLDKEKVNVEFDDNLNWDKITVKPFIKAYAEDGKNRIRELIFTNKEKDNIPNEITERLSGECPFSFGPRGKYGNIDFSDVERTDWKYNGSPSEDVPFEREQLGKFEEFSKKYIGLFEAFKNSLQVSENGSTLSNAESRRRQTDFASKQKVLANNQNSKVSGQNRRRF